MDITAGLSFLFPTLVAVLRCRGPRYFTANPGVVWVWPLIYVAIGTGVNYLGIQQTAKFDSYWSYSTLVFWRFRATIVRLLMLTVVR